MIPDQVDRNSITVNGSWTNFIVTWAPVENVNYGKVVYDVRIQTSAFENISVIINYVYLINLKKC